MPGVAHTRFDFDTVFADDGEVAYASPRPQRSYGAHEVQALEHKAFAEGERQALASMAALQAQSLAAIAQAAELALPRLAEVAHDHRVASAELALACGRAIADAALARFPQAPLKAAFEALAREIEAAPKLVVSVSPDLADGLEPILSEVAQAIGYAGAIQIRAAAGLGPAAFSLDFGDGTASFDPAAAAARVTSALEAALAAEGLHAEPLIPGSES